jgi:hypothetical protein
MSQTYNLTRRLKECFTRWGYSERMFNRWYESSSKGSIPTVVRQNFQSNITNTIILVVESCNAVKKHAVLKILEKAALAFFVKF